MRVLIMGAGALGQAVGAFLTAAGECRVDIVTRSRYVNAITEDGLYVHGVLGSFHLGRAQVSVYTGVASLLEVAYDYVLVTCKSYDTADVAQQCQLLRSQKFTIVTMQNGFGNWDILAKYFNKDRILSARVITGFEKPKLNTINVSVHADRVHIGHPYDNRRVDTAAERLAAVMNSSGIPTAAVTTIIEDLLDKLLYNCALNPLSAILNVTYGELGADANARAVISDVVYEAFHLIKCEKIFSHWEQPQEYLQLLFDKLIPATASHHSSMLQDLKNGKQTEIAMLNGYLVAKSEAHALGCHTNKTICRMIKFLEV